MVSIREASGDELDLVADLRIRMHEEVDNLPTPPDFAEATHRWLREHTKRGTMQSWLAEENGKIVGTVSVRIRESSPRMHDLSAREAYVHHLFVEQPYRKRGIARQLMQALIGWCLANGYGRIALRATSMGRPLYEQLGFSADTAQMVYKGKN